MSGERQEAVAYVEAIETWRSEQEAWLRADDGWLTVVGLFWLHDGENTIGSDPACDVVLPSSVPSHLGVITLRNDQVTFRVNAEESPVLIDGVSSSKANLHYSESDTTVVQAALTSISTEPCFRPARLQPMRPVLFHRRRMCCPLPSQPAKGKRLNSLFTTSNPRKPIMPIFTIGS